MILRRARIRSRAARSVTARPAVLDLDAVQASDRDRVGGKGAALAALRSAGLPVPPGFVLCADARVQDRDAVRAAYAALGGRVAVRSSGTAEDLEAASFAGQYESVLDVAGEAAVLAAVERCLASAARAAAYADAVGAAAGRMGVLVQRFVEPGAAGVAFTEHPGDRSALLIEAHVGRGEAVVSGRVRPSAYRVDRATLEVRGPDRGPLEPAEVARLAELALAAERLFGAPQDVEWARGPEGLVLLQSRPITVARDEALPASARRLTRANVGEVLPGPIAPLTWSSVVAVLERAFVGVARRAGVLPPDVTGPFLVLHRARVYLNLSLCLEVAMRLPGVTSADVERLMLGAGSGPRPAPRLPPLRSLRRLASVLGRLLAMSRRLPGEIADVERRLHALPDRAAIEGASFEQLAGLWSEWLAVSDELAMVHITTSGACGFRLALVQALLSRLPGDPVDLANRLLAGADGIESVRPTLALEALAAEAREDPMWRSWLAAPAGAAPPSGLGARLDAFLAEFGHRAVSEADLASPTWEDDPAPVVGALQALVASGRPPGFGHAARAAAREADLQAVRHRLGPIRGRLAAAFLERAALAIRERERTKSLAVRLVARGRRLAQATARHLSERRLLASAADVHFLRLEELLGLLDGRPVAAALLARRRRSYERESRLDAPREVDRDATPRERNAREGWTGTAVSPGVGAGPARVLCPGDVPELRPGEILVAPVLDAALGPLLASAAGAVVEIGGLLSHGAVVARELGVPCVVDVRGATSRIRNGERVEVDGSAGRVTRLVEDEAGSAGDEGLAPADPADERLHPLDPHPRARESVYFNLHDPRLGIGVIASQAVRPGGRGEAVITLVLPDGRVLFAFEIEPARLAPREFGVGGLEVGLAPPRLAFRGRLAAWASAAFPPGPVAMLLAPRVHEIELTLAFEASTPAIDLTLALDPEARRVLEPLGRHHVEQSGRFHGQLLLDGRRIALEATGSRDHSWGRREWSAADHWRLFIVRFGDDLALHALSLSCRGRRAAGGFLWAEGQALPLTRVEHSVEGSSGRLRGFDLEVQTSRGRRVQLRGDVSSRVTIPVQAETRPLALLGLGPYALLLHENFTRYRLGDREGFGVAELSERPA